MTIEEVDTRIGDLSVMALDKGGEALLDQVTQLLSVATRHSARIRADQLRLVPAVEREIAASLKRAEEALR